MQKVADFILFQKKNYICQIKILSTKGLILKTRKMSKKIISTTNAPAATLGDNNDVLAALKAKMEKSEKK